VSIEAVNYVLRHSKAAGDYLATQIVIAHHMDRDSRVSWPGNELLATELKVDTRTIQRRTSGLEKMGELYREDAKTGRGNCIGWGITGFTDQLERVTPERHPLGQKGDTIMSPFTNGKDDTATSPFKGQRVTPECHPFEREEDQERVTNEAVKGDSRSHTRGEKGKDINTPKRENTTTTTVVESPKRRKKRTVTTFEEGSWQYEFSATFFLHLVNLGIIDQAVVTEKKIQSGAAAFDQVTRIKPGYSKEDIRDTMSWLLKPDNWWMIKRAIQTPAKLMEKHDKNDCKYFETIRSQFLADATGGPSRNGRGGFGRVEAEIAKTVAAYTELD